MRIVLSNILAIYRRELQSYFASPLASVVAGVFWLLAGFFFVNLLNAFNLEVLRADSLGNTTPLDVPYQFLQSFLGVLSSVDSSLKPFSPLNPPILGDFEDWFPSNLGGEGRETQQFEDHPEIWIHGS